MGVSREQSGFGRLAAADIAEIIGIRFPRGATGPRQTVSGSEQPRLC